MSFIRGIKRTVKKYATHDITKFMNNGKRDFQTSSLCFMSDNFEKTGLKSTTKHVFTKQPINVAVNRDYNLRVLLPIR